MQTGAEFLVAQYGRHYCSGDSCLNSGSGNGKITQILDQYGHAENTGVGIFAEATPSPGNGTSQTVLQLNSYNFGGADDYAGLQLNSGTSGPQLVTSVNQNANAGVTAIQVIDGVTGNTILGNNLQYYSGGTLATATPLAFSLLDKNRSSSYDSGVQTVTTLGTGLYRVTVYGASNVACTNTTTIAWTDKDGAQSAVPLNGVTGTGSGVVLANVASGSLTYHIVIGAACGGGSGWNTNIAAERLQ